MMAVDQSVPVKPLAFGRGEPHVGDDAWVLHVHVRDVVLVWALGNVSGSMEAGGNIEQVYSFGWINATLSADGSYNGAADGDSASWLAPGLKLQVQFYEGRPIGVELPKTVKAKITETQPMMRGATASASSALHGRATASAATSTAVPIHSTRRLNIQRV